MKKLLIYFITCFLVLSSTCLFLQAGEVWKIGHVRPADSVVDNDLKKFTQTVSQKSGSGIRFAIYPANKLGDYSVVQERVSFGEVEMYLGPLATTVDKRVSLVWTPYLVEDWQQAEKVYSIGSPLWRQIDSYLNGQNVKLIGGWPVYFGGIGLTSKKSGAADPDVNKNTIIRVPPIRSFEMMARELGYIPYTITWKYARMGLKTGMVGGLIGGGAEGYAGLSDTLRYYLPVRDHFEYWFLYMNLDLWNSLTKQQQDILASAAQTMEYDRYRIAPRAEEESLDHLKKKGIEILPVTEAQYNRMRQKAQEKVWPYIREDVGDAFETVLGVAQENK